MTPEAFRKLALALPGAVESAHGGHPDFRAPTGRVFASLGYPDDEHGMVKLTPDQQTDFIERQPAAFFPCKGVWGQRGATAVHLSCVSKSTLQEALQHALSNAAPPAKKTRPSKKTAS